jgi:hypothetical protein
MLFFSITTYLTFAHSSAYCHLLLHRTAGDPLNSFPIGGKVKVNLKIIQSFTKDAHGSGHAGSWECCFQLCRIEKRHFFGFSHSYSRSMPA